MPVVALSSWPVSGTPAIVGVSIATGCGAITADATREPRYRSPSTQPLIPGTRLQFVHCQKLQPLAAQFEAGTRGAGTCQCATQRLEPPAAKTLASPTAWRQKVGDE